MPGPTIELLFFPGCPHVPAAREQLRRALAHGGLPVRWAEHDVTAPDAPPHVRGYGSPTILVDGQDVTGERPSGGSSCRLYLSSEVPGAPALETLIAALRAAADRER